MEKYRDNAGTLADPRTEKTPFAFPQVCSNAKMGRIRAMNHSPRRSNKLHLHENPVAQLTQSSKNNLVRLVMVTSVKLAYNWKQCFAALLLYASASSASIPAALAGELDGRRAAAIGTPKALSHGELVFHGNYCGPGNRSGARPVDALDVACMHHDACTFSGKIQSCACNAQLVKEAKAVAQNRAQPAALRSVASLTATAAAAGLVFCTKSRVGLPKKQRPPPSSIKAIEQEGKADTLQALPIAPNPAQETVQPPRAP